MSEESDVQEEIEKLLKARQDAIWAKNARKAFDWFLTFIDEKQWLKRKKEIVKYFKDQQSATLQLDGATPISMEEEAARVAFHKDWIAWYMYLIESIHDRPFVDECSQAARINPFFSAIGRHMELAKNIAGVENKIMGMVNGNDNQPDSTLFELLVAILYARNGWEVEFISEHSTSKTPDLLVKRKGEQFYVECKRLAKVTGYSEEERAEWRKRWSLLCSLLEQNGESMYVEVTFKVEIKETKEDCLLEAFMALVHHDAIDTHIPIESDEIKIVATHIDMNNANTHFEQFMVRMNSPQLIDLYSNNTYQSHGSYTLSHAPTQVYSAGPEGDEDILNLFCGGVRKAYCGRWACVADKSIDKKAKDVKKLLSKAVEQAPENEPTIVHIGYETLHGPHIEIERSQKIYNSLATFNFKDKPINAIYCHALQPEVDLGGYGFAETTQHYGRGGDPTKILPHRLLLDEEDVEVSEETHWHQDLQGKEY